ncbi:MobA/MobL family protein, partial [Aerococcus urinaeequi]|uniref:MobA/MobL family protein n=1 Tax=Aerococcus urinaeequi TaxID=51665 RepID=UPI003D6B7363
FVDEGMVADVAIHRDDNNNPHAHIMLTNRPFNPDGTWGSKAKIVYILDKNGNKQRTENGNIRSRKDNTTNWNDKETLNKWRKNWAKITNQFLEKNQISERITEQSYAEQGLEIEPTIHEGYVAREMEKRGQLSDRCEENRQIQKRNYAQNQTRSEAVKAERLREISASLSPQEKQNIVKIAKSLRTTINPQT